MVALRRFATSQQTPTTRTRPAGWLELDTARNWIYRGWQSRWGDRQSWRLEERLPHLFQGIEQRVAEAERVAEEERIAAEKAAVAARREAKERERRWHELMAKARERLVEAQRETTLREQSDAWHQAERLRRYCDAMDAAHGDHADTARWIAWARGYATRLDPLTEPPAMPDPPDPSPEALQPYLPDGWSAHGPERRPGPGSTSTPGTEPTRRY